MYWIILMGMLGQTPTPSHSRTMAEIRRNLNRFDELDNIALQAKAKSEAVTLKEIPNPVRRVKLRSRLETFSSQSLGVSPPWQDAELAMIDNIVEDAAKFHDFTSCPIQQKQWINTSQGVVWGWNDVSTGQILYYPNEQQRQSRCSTCPR